MSLEERQASLVPDGLLEKAGSRQKERSLIIRSERDRNPIRKNIALQKTYQTFRMISTAFKFVRETIKPCTKEMPGWEGPLQTLI